MADTVLSTPPASNSSPETELLELLKLQYLPSAQGISVPPPPSGASTPTKVPSPTPRSFSPEVSTSRSTSQNTLRPFTHTRMRRNNHSPPETISPPAIAISHPMGSTHGYGRLRHLDRMKQEQFAKNAHEPFTIRWDEKNLSAIINALEGCGDGMLRFRKPYFNPRAAPMALFSGPNSYNYQSRDAAKFDPRAPHFDVILVDLTNALAEPKLVGDSVKPNSAAGFGSQQLKDGEQPSGSFAARTTNMTKTNPFRSDINDLPMESLAGRPGWLFLWVGRTEHLVEARRILGKWGFRKIECIGWIKVGGRWDKVKISPEEEVQNSSEIKSGGMFRRGIEWCLVGVKGTAKRSYDSHLIHCNVNTDVIISDSLNTPKSTLLSKVIENFSQGNRRLHLFANPGDERAGWVTVGKDFKETTFDCRKYMKSWEGKGKHGWLTDFDPEIEYFRPKTPPLQVRKRERARAKNGNRGGGNPGRGRERAGDDDLPKFPHTGQKARPIVHYNEGNPKDKKYFRAAVYNQKARGPSGSRVLPKLPMGLRVSQLSGVSPNHHHVQQRRGLKIPLKPSGLINQLQPSPTVGQFRPKEFPEAPQPRPVLKVTLRNPLTAEPRGAEHNNYTSQTVTRNSDKVLPEAPPISSIVNTSPPEPVHGPYPRRFQPSLLPPGPVMGPSSLDSRFGSLNIRSQTPSHQSRLDFRPANPLHRQPGNIGTANRTMHTHPTDGFRTETRIPQVPIPVFGGYGDISSLGLGEGRALYPRTSYQQDQHQQPSIHSSPSSGYINYFSHAMQPGNHLAPQHNQYTYVYEQIRQLEQQHQQQWQLQVSGAQYPVPGFQQQQNQFQQPGVGQYGAYGFQHHNYQNQQPQGGQYGGYGFQPHNEHQNAFQEQELLLRKAQYDSYLATGANKNPAGIPPSGPQQPH